MSKWLKMTCVLLSVALLITCMPTFTLASDGSFSLNTEIESGETYYIRNFNDFKTFIKLINQRGQTCEGATFELISDIVINDGVFSLDENNIPLYNGEEITEESDIMLCESAMTFKGTFVGNNHSISGFYCNSQGLFDEISGAEICTLTIKNSLFDLRQSPKENVGAFCGTAENSVFANLTFEGIIINSESNTGGIVGKATDSDFDFCKNNGTVIGSDYCGGIVGLQTGTKSMVDCMNYGNVISDGNYVGGITSTIGTDTLVIDGCTNVGSVESTGDYVGGIAGTIELDSNVMYDCYHTGSVSGNDYVGGFTGSFYTPGEDLMGVIMNLESVQSTIDAYRDYYVGDGYEYAVYPPIWAVNNGLVYLFDERDSYVDYINTANPKNLLHSYSAGDVIANGEYVGAFFGEFSGCVWRCYNNFYNSAKDLLASGKDSFDTEWYKAKRYANKAAHYLPSKGIYAESESEMKTEQFADQIGCNRPYIVDTINENNGFVLLYDHHDFSVHLHSYTSEITTESTCTTRGVRTYTCSCGDTYTEEVPRKAHDHVLISSVPATCSTRGEQTYKCNICGTVELVYKPAEKGHKFITEVVKEPTCESEGIEVTTCSRCDYYQETAIEAKSHSWSGWEHRIYPKALSDGLEVCVCYRCGAEEHWHLPAVLSDFQVNNGMVSGFSAGSTFDDILYYFNLDYSVDVYAISESTLGTGDVITLTYGDGTQEEFEVVIYGDTNGDSWYDGQDAIIVDCLANGMLTKEDVGEAIYMAADCNHDGVIDQLDVDIINQAGTMLADVDQTLPTETLLETSSYASYSRLIDQSPEIIIEDDESIVEKEEIPEPEAGTEKTEPETDETPEEEVSAFVKLFNAIPDFLAIIFKWLTGLFV